MSMLKQLASSNYISVNKSLIKIFGLTEAVLLGELCSEYDYWERNDKLEDGMFYSSVANIEENTGLSDYQQRQAIQSLKNCGILETVLKGLPATRYFRINEDKLLSYLRTSSEKTKELDVKKLKSSNNITNKNKKNNNNSTINSTVSDHGDTFEFGKQKKPKQNMYDKCISLIQAFTDDIVLQEMLIKTLQIFLDNSRESGTPFYTNNFKGKLNTLKRLSTDNYTQRKIVSQTIEKGWNNFYQLKTDNTFLDTPKTSHRQYDEKYIEESDRKMAERKKNGQRTEF